MPTNNAAWLPANNEPLKVGPAPYTSPSANEVVIKNHAIAINPVDSYMQSMGPNLFSDMFHPYILGSDLAGKIVEVGSCVTRFKPGDRVLGFGLGSVVFEAPKGAFQEYTVVPAVVVAHIPDSLPYEKAAVLPMGLSVSGTGLFQKNYLGLEYPSLNPKPTGKTLLVWGGATSMASNAIQLAVAAGYEVVTTASAKNFEYVKNLGASQVFDYNSKTVVEDLIEALEGKDMAGVFDGVGFYGAFEACVAVISKTKGSKFIAACQHPKDIADGSGVTAKFIMGAELRENEVGKVIYEDFMPAALAAGKYIAVPEPKIAGKGLESLQAAIDLWKAGVSASKIVVTL
ncbi:zinc-binding oxidoreductase CipB [Cadophora sp. MPI-SDFR-AT-0126]|nr:zinc-binding oxidoreductase CipB [Leotiomycetes sp. MPI-SDFR-AT-0126]